MPNSLGKPMQSISMERHISDLHRDKIDDCGKFLKKSDSAANAVKLIQLNYSYLKIEK